MAERVWSKYQQAIFEHVETKTSNLVIEALAGSGKSTVIEEIVRRIPRNRRVCVSAFNKSTREELERRIKLPNVQVKTFHQIGFGAVRSMWPNVEVLSTRQRDILSMIIPGGSQMPPGALSDVSKLVSMAMSRLAKTDNDFYDIMDTYECGPRDEKDRERYLEWARKCLTLSQEADGRVSYDDQIYLPIAMGLSLPRYDDVLVDEAQDCNPLQLELLTRSVKRDGRFIAVGDAHQAIYSFRGADSNTMEMLVQRMSADRLPLSVCYRCPTEVVRLAQSVVPEFEAAPNAAKGEVRVCRKDEIFDEAAPGDLIISRKNAVLAQCLIELLRRGKRCFILGKDFGAGLTAFIRKFQVTTIVELTERIKTHVQTETHRLMAANKEEQVTALTDRVEMIDALSEGLTTVSSLLAQIENIFGDSAGHAGAITLSSVHKAKGLEFDRVWMIESSFSRATREGSNLYYVAVTRAKKQLNLVLFRNNKGNFPRSPGEEWMNGEIAE